MIDQDTRQALTTPMRKALDKYELGIVPSLLELKVGSPSRYEGLTMEARALINYANSMKRVIQDVGAVHFRSHADSTLTDGGKLSRSANYASKQIELARKNFKTHYENAEAELDRNLYSLNQALKPPASAGEVAIDSELRAYVRTLKPAEAAEVIRKDEALLAAVSRAPALLSGLAQTVHETIKNEYLAKIKPDEFAKYDELINVIKTANQAISALESEAKGLIDFDTASRIESRKLVEL